LRVAGTYGEEFVFPELGGSEAAEALHPEVTGTPLKVRAGHPYHKVLDGPRGERSRWGHTSLTVTRVVRQVFDPLRKPPKSSNGMEPRTRQPRRAPSAGSMSVTRVLQGLTTALRCQPDTVGGWWDDKIAAEQCYDLIADDPEAAHMVKTMVMLPSAVWCDLIMGMEALRCEGPNGAPTLAPLQMQTRLGPRLMQGQLSERNERSGRRARVRNQHAHRAGGERLPNEAVLQARRREEMREQASVTHGGAYMLPQGPSQVRGSPSHTYAPQVEREPEAGDAGSWSLRYSLALTHCVRLLTG